MARLIHVYRISSILRYTPKMLGRMARRKVKYVWFPMMILLTLYVYIYVLKDNKRLDDTRSTTRANLLATERQAIITKKRSVHLTNLIPEPRNHMNIEDFVKSDKSDQIPPRRLPNIEDFVKSDKSDQIPPRRLPIKKFVKRADSQNKSSAIYRNVTNRYLSVSYGSSYFQNLTRKVTPLDHTFLLPSVPCSSVNPPLLVIMCISKYDHFSTRKVIRHTWGSVSKSKVWPLNNVDVSDVKLVFILGRETTVSAKDKHAFNQEDKEHGDIVVVDFVDSYYNLTRKVLLGLKWVTTFCADAEYVFKVDEDTFVHVANLVSYLKSLKPYSKGVMIGHVYPRPPVLRVGKWGLDVNVYPYPYFPPYVCGNSYVISVNVIHRLVELAEYLPYVFIEDAAITGILRTAVNATLIFDGGFTFFARPPPKLCDFHNNATIKSATKTDDRLKVKLWKAFKMTYPECKRNEAAMNNTKTIKRKHI